MNRKECYAFIKANPVLADEIKQDTGKNYTNCSTNVLLEYVNKEQKVEKLATAVDEVKTTTLTPKVCCNTSITERLLEVLVNKRILLNKERDYILKG